MMAKRNGKAKKANGKGSPVVELLGDVRGWLRTLDVMAEAGCSREAMAQIAYTLGCLVEASAEALRAGERPPKFEDFVEGDEPAAWLRDARIALARVASSREESSRDAQAADHLIRIAQRWRTEERAARGEGR